MAGAHTTFTNGVTLTDAGWFQDVDTVAYTLFGNGTSYTGVLTLAGTTQSTSTSTGQAIIAGGMGLAKNLWVGGTGNFAGTLTLSGTSANLQTGANFISYDGTDAGLSFDSSNNATFSVKATATAFVPSGSTVPTNGMYLPAANTLGWATNSALGMTLDSTGNLIIGSGYGTTAATGANYKNIYVGGGALQGNTTNGSVFLNANLDGVGKAIYTGGASWYQQSAGAHNWYGIASTTAGVAPTLTNWMTLDTTGRLYVRANITDYCLRIEPANAVPYGLYIPYSSSPNNSGNSFFYFQDSAGGGTARAYLSSDGGLHNFTANNVNLSDLGVKPLTCKYDTNKLWNFGKAMRSAWMQFKYEDQTHDDWNNGYGAQLVKIAAGEDFPELVSMQNWGTPDKPKMLLSVYDSDLMHLMGAIVTESQFKIDDLIERVSKLEDK